MSVPCERYPWDFLVRCARYVHLAQRTQLKLTPALIYNPKEAFGVEAGWHKSPCCHTSSLRHTQEQHVGERDRGGLDARVWFSGPS